VAIRVTLASGRCSLQSGWVLRWQYRAFFSSRLCGWAWIGPLNRWRCSFRSRAAVPCWLFRTRLSASWCRRCRSSAARARRIGLRASFRARLFRGCFGRGRFPLLADFPPTASAFWSAPCSCRWQPIGLQWCSADLGRSSGNLFLVCWSCPLDPRFLCWVAIIFY